MKVLVTGANGLLGHHVVMELLQRNLNVRILVRSTSKIKFDMKRVEVKKGSFADKQAITEAAQNCDAIIHIAAITDTNLLKYEDYEKINSDATHQLLQVASELNIKKFVFVSTCNTVGYGNHNHLADETYPIQYPFTRSFYAQSKLKAEILCANYAQNNHLIIVNPTFMIGNYDTKPSSGALVLMGYKKRFLIIPNGGKNFVPVKDVAITCCNALTMGISGERYLAAGVNLSFKEYFQLQKRVGGYQQKIVVVPDFMLKIAGYVGDILRFAHIKISVCSRNINQLLIQEYYTNKKAKKELLLPESSLELAIDEALEWFKSIKLIK